MMMPNDRNHWIWKVDRGKICSDIRVCFHYFELGISELSWLIQDVLGYGQFAHIV